MSGAAFALAEVSAGQTVAGIGLIGTLRVRDHCLWIESSSTYLVAFDAAAGATADATGVTLDGARYPLGEELQFSGTVGSPGPSPLKMPEACTGQVFYVDGIFPAK